MRPTVSCKLFEVSNSGFGEIDIVEHKTLFRAILERFDHPDCECRSGFWENLTGKNGRHDKSIDHHKPSSSTWVSTSPTQDIRNKITFGLKGLAIWIVPDEDIFTEIMHIRTGKAKPPSYPEFPPHVTLALLPQHIQVDAVQDALNDLFERPFSVKFASIEIGSQYFRSVYVSMHLTEDIARLHSDLHKQLQIEPRTPSFPHLSLCYISDEDAEKGERQAFYNAIEEGGLVVQSNDGIALRSKPSDQPKPGFLCKEIWLVDCEGDVEKWPIIAKYHAKS